MYRDFLSIADDHSVGLLSSVEADGMTAKIGHGTESSVTLCPLLLYSAGHRPLKTNRILRLFISLWSSLTLAIVTRRKIGPKHLWLILLAAWRPCTCHPDWVQSPLSAIPSTPQCLLNLTYATLMELFTARCMVCPETGIIGVSCGCCNKSPTWWLQTHTCLLFWFWRSEVWHGSHWAKIQVTAGLSSS